MRTTVLTTAAQRLGERFAQEWNKHTRGAPIDAAAVGRLFQEASAFLVWSGIIAVYYAFCRSAIDFAEDDLQIAQRLYEGFIGMLWIATLVVGYWEIFVAPHPNSVRSTPF